MSMHLRGSRDMMGQEEEGWWKSRTGLEQKLIIFSTLLFIVAFSLTITVIVFKNRKTDCGGATTLPPTGSTSSDQTPTDNTSSDQTPTGNTSSDQTPTGNTSSDQSPTSPEPTSPEPSKSSASLTSSEAPASPSSSILPDSSTGSTPDPKPAP